MMAVAVCQQGTDVVAAIAWVVALISVLLFFSFLAWLDK